MNYNQLRSNHENHEIATRQCIEQIIDFQKDLLTHILPSENSLHRLRVEFGREPWCATLFHNHDDTIAGATTHFQHRFRQFQ